VNATVFEAHGGDALRQRLGKVGVAGADDMADSGHQFAIADHIVEIVADLAAGPDGRFEIDSDPLVGNPLMLMHADAAIEHHIANEHAQFARLGFGARKGTHHLGRTVVLLSCHFGSAGTGRPFRRP
jgi:hypothetical protein